MSAWNETVTTHKHRQRQHIAATALALIEEHGLAGVSMSLLARRSGIARATLYNYFPDLESVLAAVVAEQVTTAITRLRQHLDTTNDPAEQLNRTLRTLLDWLADRPRGRHTDPAARLSPYVVATMHEPLGRVQELIRGILDRGVADGTFTATVDPGQHAHFIVRLLFGLDLNTDDPQRQRAVTEQLSRFVLTGLGHRPADR